MFKDDIFKEKTIVITGGGTGLGKSMAEKISSLGANIIIVSRKYDVLKKTAEEIQGKTGNTVKPIQPLQIYTSLLQ